MTEPIPVSASPITNVLLVTRFDRREKTLVAECKSLPGHLIQLMVAGKVAEQCNGREYTLRPGQAIWYHEDERVITRVLAAPWVYYGVNFIAPTLPPPEFDARVLSADATVTACFEELWQAWNATTEPASRRALRLHLALLQVLLKLTPEHHRFGMDPPTQLWWRVETELRKRLHEPITVAKIEQITGRPRALIARSCEFAVGTSPLKRMKQVRMSLARSLVRASGLRITEIAERVGYQRVNEFSRDYHRHFGVSPKQDSRQEWTRWAIAYKRLSAHTKVR